MANYLFLLLPLALALLFLWLATRAWRNRRAWIKWPALVLTGLLGLLLIAMTGMMALGFYRLQVAPHQYATADVKVAMTQENIAKGERLAHICVDCHSSTGSLPLDGSKEDFMKSPGAPPVGSMWAPNLTPGGPLKDWTDGEIMRAIREGVDKDNRPLVIMPSMAFHQLSDADTQALVAYLRSQPAVNRDLPERSLNGIAALFFGSGMFPTSAQEPITSPVVAPPGGTPEHGKYLVYSLGCPDCHGPNLDGVVTGPGPGTGAPNLTKVVPNWKEEDFITFFRQGMDPSGRKLGDEMPWKSYNSAFTDEELRDIYSYLHSLPPMEANKQ